ncbi:MAG: hypothetical protein GY838_15035 [bacterium]|nr:hypothetical protein [bacterium]
MLRRCPLFFCALFLLLAAASAAAGDEPVVRCSFTEQWRRGAEDDDLFFGMVAAVRRGPDGLLYLLDSQRNQVVVLDGGGELVRTLGREGDGPGEFRRPVGLEFLDDRTLGVVQRLPGKVILLDLDGTPRGTIHAGGPEAADQGGAFILTGVRARGGTLVFSGEEFHRGMYTQLLAVVDAEGRERHRLLERPRGRLIVTRLFVERDEDFVQHGRWNLGPDGHVYLAPHRDRFAVEVRGAAGELVSTVEGRCRAHGRTAEEIEEIQEAVVMMLDGRRVRLDSEVEPNDPCVERLQVTDAGELHVLTSEGARDNPDRIFETWDVFDAAGGFSHRLEVEAPGDPRSDRLVLLPDGRALLLKGWVQAGRAVRPRLDGQEDRVDPDDVWHYVIGLGRAN